MFRSSYLFFKQRAASPVFRPNPSSFRRRNPDFVESSNRLRAGVVYSSIGGSGGGGGALGLELGQGEKVNDGNDDVTFAEAKKQMKLISEGKETMCYSLSDSLSNALSKQRATSAVFRRNPVSFWWRNTGFVECNSRLRACVFSSSIGGSGGGGGVLGLGLGQGEKVNDGKEDVTFAEAKKQMKLISEGKETMCYSLSNALSKQRATTAVFRRNPVSFRWRNNGFVECNNRLRACVFSSAIGGSGGGGGGGGLGLGQGEKVNDGKEDVTFAEAKKLMKLVDVEALKRKLITEGNETMCYSDLVDVCESMGVTKSIEESKEFVKVLDEAGVVLIFRDKVYLHPDKVVDLVRRAVPLALTPEDDPRREELRVLQAKQQEIDALAHKQVRCILWTGLGFSLAQISLFFRLTFWELSWDVMEPIAFFTTTSGLIIGYAYFLFTSSDPTYQDLMKRLFLSRRRKLIKKHNFNAERFKELQRKCKSPLDSYPAAKHHIPGVKLETQDL